MPRRPPLETPGGRFHIVARGVVRRLIFLDDFDYEAFVSMLHRTVVRFEWKCLAYALMPNHVHLVVETAEPNRGAGMRYLSGWYAQRFNERHDAVGHLFQGPYRAVAIESESHLLEVARYVALNPVRAGLCDRPEDWPWSSHPGFVTFGRHPRFVSRDVMHLFGGDDRTAREAYRQFVNDGL